MNKQEKKAKMQRLRARYDYRIARAKKNNLDEQQAANEKKAADSKKFKEMLYRIRGM